MTICDPHLATNEKFYVYKNAPGKNYFIKNKYGYDFNGVCWPGECVWVDFINSEASKYWSQLYSYESYKDSTQILYTWNDMNEPSMFGSPFNMLPPDCVHRLKK